MRFTVAVAMCDPTHYLPLAIAAEENGWDSLAVPDGPFYPEHVSASYPYTPDGSRFWPPDTPFVEPWSAIPAMAAVTQRLRFYTNVLKLPIRNPLLVAKAVGTAAVLSGNRVGLGVGLSWIPEEFAYCGADYRSRGPRTTEAIQVLREVLRGGMVEFHGRYYDFGRLQMSPAPSEPVPIYVGGHSKPALRRAARHGDGWISVNATTSDLLDCIETLAGLRSDFGRKDEPFEIHAMPTDVRTAGEYARLGEKGVSDIVVWPWMLYGGDPRSLEAKRDALKRFADEVIARFR